MATNPTRRLRNPPEMRDFAEKSVEQARKAIDGFMSAAQKTADTFEGSANTVQTSATRCSPQDLRLYRAEPTAAFDLAQRMVRAKDMQEAMQIQAEFVRSQFEAMQTQMKEFGSLAQSAMKQPGVARSNLSNILARTLTMAEAKKPRARRPKIAARSRADLIELAAAPVAETVEVTVAQLPMPAVAR